MERKKLYKGFSSKINDVDEKQGIISGLFAHFGSKDKHGDIIQKGAFKKTIAELGPKGTDEIAHLLDHKGDHAVAKILELEETDGLKYVSKIGTHDLGRNFMEMVTSGIIKFHSIGYSTIKEEYDKESKANFLKEVKLWEGSSLQFIAANHNTPVLGLKEFDTEEDALEYLDLLEKFVRNSKATDELLKPLEEKLNSLLKLLKPSPDTSKVKEAEYQKINTLFQTLESWKN